MNGKRDLRKGRQRKQFKTRRCEDTERSASRFDRPVRIGKIFAGFDTIYAEGQRRYVESLSSYARQFLGQMDKPDVELIEGLSPAISIDQKTTSKPSIYRRYGDGNPRLSEAALCEDRTSPLPDLRETDYQPDCRSDGGLHHGIPRRHQDHDFSAGGQAEKREHEKILERIRKEGFTRVRIDGEIRLINEE